MSSSGFNHKGSLSSSWQTREKPVLSLTEADWTQIYFRPRNMGDYWDPACTPSPPCYSWVQLCDEHTHTPLRQTAEFQRHFSYLLPPLNTAGESQDSAVVTENYLWWEICGGKSMRGKKTLQINSSCASPWKQKTVQLRKNVFSTSLVAITSGWGEMCINAVHFQKYAQKCTRSLKK